MDTQLIFNAALISKYDKAGPRYTSYPTAVQFHDDFNTMDYRQAALASNKVGRPLSLYVHIPFCNTVCFYCACNKVITNNRRRASVYLEHLFREIELQGELFDNDRPVRQLHWGGGTPTYIAAEEMAALMAKLGEHFTLSPEEGEYAIEIDPRTVDGAGVAQLRALGFNRMSIGVQDFDPLVQRAINRVQPLALTADIVAAARQQGFRSISFDLIYGLPHQSVDSFDKTLSAVIALAPDRLSIFNYAHLPHLFKVQRQIDEATLPSAAEKLNILARTIERLTAAGYVYIGMDHFAKPDDELTIAQRSGTLTRNFQGYSTHEQCDIVALGASAIGKIGNTYSQNDRNVIAYHHRLQRDELAIVRGVTLTPDDRLRRAVINQLICHFGLDRQALGEQFGIDQARYFAREWQVLAAMADDGLLTLDQQRLEVLPPGRLLIRNICMVFDAYLQHTEQRRFSKVI